MPTSVLICDDSRFARKQIQRALPEDWNIVVSFATNGQECLDAIDSNQGDIVFLDLTMPVMTGYEVLDQMQQQGLQNSVIVVSGDIQPDAVQKVKALGALEFVKKPVDKHLIIEILNHYGLYSGSQGATNA